MSDKKGILTKKNSGDYYVISKIKYSKDDPQLIWDCEKKTYTVLNDNHVFGITGIRKDKRRNVFKFGYFDKKDKVVLYQNNLVNEIYVLDDSIIHEYNKLYYKPRYIYSKVTDIFYNSNLDLPISKDDTITLNDDHKANYYYNVSPRHLDLLNRSICKYRDDYEYTIRKSFIDNGLEIDGVLENLTFGVEFETSGGYIPSRKLKTVPLIPLRDGSISGFEYATGVLSGYTGINHLSNIVELLRNHTDYNDDCSIHFHVGGLPRTEKHILAMYLTVVALQNELFDINPHYKFSHYGVKRKNYTAPYDINLYRSIINAKEVPTKFEILFNELSNNDYSNYDYKLDNVTGHPDDPDNTRKWVIKSRYHLVNLIPIIFGNKKTVEFRLSQSTHKSRFVFYELLLNLMIVQYVIKNVDVIVNNRAYIDLARIIDSYNEDCNARLINHIYTKRKIKESASSRSEIKYNIDHFYNKSEIVTFKDLPKFKHVSNFTKNGNRVEDILYQEIEDYKFDRKLMSVTMFHKHEEVIQNVGILEQIQLLNGNPVQVNMDEINDGVGHENILYSICKTTIMNTLRRWCEMGRDDVLNIVEELNHNDEFKQEEFNELLDFTINNGNFGNLPQVVATPNEVKFIHTNRILNDIQSNVTSISKENISNLFKGVLFESLYIKLQHGFKVLDIENVSTGIATLYGYVVDRVEKFRNDQIN